MTENYCFDCIFCDPLNEECGGCIHPYGPEFMAYIDSCQIAGIAVSPMDCPVFKPVKNELLKDPTPTIRNLEP